MKIGRFFSTSLLILPFLEFFLFFQVAAIIGLFPALGAIALSALLCISILKSVGLSSLPRIQMALTRGEIPAQEVADSTLTGLGAVLLIIPGFMTDLLSILFIIPPFRQQLIRYTLNRASSSMNTPGTKPSNKTIEGEFRRED